MVQVPGPGVIVIIVLQGSQPGRLPGSADHFADEPNATVTNGRDVAARAVGHAGRGHDLPGQPSDVARFVIHHPAVDRHGPDGREAVPPVVVRVPVLTFPEVLFRVDEILLVPVRTEYLCPLLVQANGAVRVVAEMVGEQDRNRFAPGNFVEMIRCQTGTGIDEYDALGSVDGVD